MSDCGDHTAPGDTDDTALLRGLLDAHRRITDDLSISAVLDHVVETVSELVGAEFAALEVFDTDGSRERLVSAGHPDDIRSRLLVPIRVRGRTVGELYVGDPSPDRFGSDAKKLLVTLADAAGTAIENARLYDEARRSHAWLQASGEVTRELLGDAHNGALPAILVRAFRLAEADYVSLILPTEGEALRVTSAVGLGCDEYDNLIFDPSTSLLGKSILAAESVRTDDVRHWARPDYDNRHEFGPAMIVPLITHGDRGAMLMMRVAGRPAFTQRDADLAATFAAQVALAMELNEAREEAERNRALAERDLLARDLHDNVMQRVFATGVGLQALVGQVPDPVVAERLRQHIADLDDTLGVIRSELFGLRAGLPQNQ